MANNDPIETADRADIMRRDAYIVGILGMGAANGMHFSPYYLPARLLLDPFVQVTFFTSSPIVISYLTSLVVSTLSIMFAGIPAALYERARGMRYSDATSFGIWLAFMVLITVPTIMNIAQSG
jgi:hypothetical protein